MVTLKHSSSSANGARSSLTDPAYLRGDYPQKLALGLTDPDEVRRLVRVGCERGLIHFAGEKAAIEKNGQDISTSGPLRSQWIDVTPALAEKWLANNFRNRPLREDTVKAYARDMINGVWVLSHQGMAFNDKDELIDGQHRLHAIVLSGVAVRTMVTFGLPSKIDGKEMTTMDAVDRGATRSVADQLTIQHGFKNGSITASICAAIASICYGERTRRLSVGQTLDVYRTFEHAITWIIAHKSKERGIRSTGVAAGFAFAIASESPSRAGGGDPDVMGSTPICFMFEKLVTGEEPVRKIKKKSPSKTWAQFSPIARLRAFLTSDEAQLITRSLDRGLAELVLQAIYLEQKEKPISKLEMSLDGANHFRELQKDRVEKVRAIFELPKQRDVASGLQKKVA